MSAQTGLPELRNYPSLRVQCGRCGELYAATPFTFAEEQGLCLPCSDFLHDLPTPEAQLGARKIAVYPHARVGAETV